MKAATSLVTAVCGGLLFLNALSGCTVRTRVRRPLPPPAVVEVIPVAPSAGYVWSPGYHQWRRRGYVWVPGRYRRVR